MDDLRFDGLTKAFAWTSTRRGAFRLIGGAVAGAVGLRAATAEAARCTTAAECGPCQICEPGRNGRPDRCVANPAAEGNSCGGDCGVCSNGHCRHDSGLCSGCDRCDPRSMTCVSTCRPNQICCDGRCRRAGDGCCTDDADCGECQTCAAGICMPRVDSSPCGVCGVCQGGNCVAGPDDVCGTCATCHPNGSQCIVDPEGTPCGECGTCSGRTCVPAVGRCSQSEGACSTCDPRSLRCSAPVRCDACELCGQGGCGRADEVLCGTGRACCDQTGECGPVANPCCENGVACGTQCCTVVEGCCGDGGCVERECPGCSFCDPNVDACVEGCPHPCQVCDAEEVICRGPRQEVPYCESCGNDGMLYLGEACNGTHCCWGDDHCDGEICCSPRWKNCCGRCVFETIDCSAAC